MNVVVREGTIEEAVALSLKISEFRSPPGLEEYKKRLIGTKHLVLIAEADGAAGGFKAGYDRHLDGKVFYSWMGGVLKGFRHSGVATLLLEKMESWCRDEGFSKLQFKTRNSHSKMIGFAYARGFWLVDFQRKGRVEDNRLIFEKSVLLRPNS